MIHKEKGEKDKKQKKQQSLDEHVGLLTDSSVHKYFPVAQKKNVASIRKEKQ
jgi:hypothetical protein